MTFKEAIDNLDIKAVRRGAWLTDAWIELATVDTTHLIDTDEVFKERENEYCKFHTSHGVEWIHTDLVLLLSDTDDWEVSQ